MNKKLLTLSTAAVAAALALAGCAPSSGNGISGMDHSSTAPASGTAGSTDGSPTAADAEHNAADTMFAQMMIPHHAQAVEMSEMMLSKENIPAPVTELATRIKKAQAPEIETMTAWLTSWNEPTEAPTGHDMASHSMASGMDGMMSDDDLKKLDAAQGTEAARLFLTQMIAHHEGAVVMAETEGTDGKNPDAVALAKIIASSQEKEIQEMKELLAAL
ncbi:DUF305 domain-containing protein [Arthrobacter sp. ISL-72]|uniref:DUF305 domain-containing protein n=1 Tax=Arthrobacter sp. ISL-72 TaxID=2819114 RepID=UPI001BE6D805|nr:DUF305 domain-containing protein [Arthrobacter sp. ISL-72]MBT2595638.1 DUF305 domain-containing protein [Arthrobacter sp. ISL-72]